MSALWIGSLGVAILLIAFVLNLMNILSERSSTYLLANMIGSLMAGWYAWTDQIIPFVILEAIWGGVALVRLVITLTKSPRLSGG